MKHQQPTAEEDPTKVCVMPRVTVGYIELSTSLYSCHLSLQLEIKIPLVQLSFASSSGLKRIPKKRPASERGESPDAKKQKTSPAAISSKVVLHILQVHVA